MSAPDKKQHKMKASNTLRSSSSSEVASTTTRKVSGPTFSDFAIPSRAKEASEILLGSNLNSSSFINDINVNNTTLPRTANSKGTTTISAKPSLMNTRAGGRRESAYRSMRSLPLGEEPSVLVDDMNTEKNFNNNKKLAAHKEFLSGSLMAQPQSVTTRKKQTTVYTSKGNDSRISLIVPGSPSSGVNASTVLRKGTMFEVEDFDFDHASLADAVPGSKLSRHSRIVPHPDVRVSRSGRSQSMRREPTNNVNRINSMSNSSQPALDIDLLELERLELSADEPTPAHKPVKGVVTKAASRRVPPAAAPSVANPRRSGRVIPTVADKVKSGRFEKDAFLPAAEDIPEIAMADAHDDEGRDSMIAAFVTRQMRKLKDGMGLP